MRELLNIVIVGHVDHGKSTLVGRLLHDTKSMPQDKLDKVKRICKEQGKRFEYAFLLDAFEEEQKQGITIDVSRIHFATKKRDYVIIDTPGHKEFLKNMFSGASTAEAAFLMIDAEEGIQEQSKQHAYLLHLLGIKNVFVVVNKMDLVDYSEKRFEAIKLEFMKHLKALELSPKAFIPIAAINGINIKKTDAKCGWYKDLTICEAIDAIPHKKREENKPLRMTIQDVYKFDSRRLLAGRIESGTISVGDEILFSPGNRVAKVQSFESWPEKDSVKKKARAGESVALTLNQQLFVERGHILSHLDAAPCLANEFEATLFWLGNDPLKLKGMYEIRFGTQRRECRIEKIKTIIAASGECFDGGSEVRRYDAAEVVLRTKQPVAFDDFADIQETGRFVLVDNNIVSGGGRARLGEYPNLRESGNDIVKSKNITWHFSKVTTKEREARYQHRGGVIWLTGLSGSGKSTIATELEKELFSRGVHVFVLDGDNVRHGLNTNLAFSPDDRAENIRRVGEVAKLFAEAGIIVITAFISPYRSGRDMVRRSVGDRFIEVFVDCPIEMCEFRDPKGLYKKARAGEIDDFTGISAPYEMPAKPEIEIRTDKVDVDKSVETIIDYLSLMGFIPVSCNV